MSTATRTRSLIRLAIFTLFALLWPTTLSMATAPAHVTASPVCAYDAAARGAELTHDHVERGQPVSLTRHAVSAGDDAVDHGSHGASERVAITYSTLIDGYDHMPPLALRDIATCSWSVGQAEPIKRDSGEATWRYGSISGTGVATKTADDWPKLGGMLRDASRGKGNFTVGSATQEQAQAMGMSWVGEGATLSKSGNAWLSADGLHAYRPMSYKDGMGMWRANLETRVPGQVSRGPISNAHIDILDPP